MDKECAPRKHDYEFLGNKVFTTAKSGAKGCSVRMSVGAVYRCRKCSKVRRGPVNPNAPWPD